MKLRMMLLSLAFALATTHAFALVTVTDYNWLQLNPGLVTTSVSNNLGNTTGTGGYGDPTDFRWGDHVWIPSDTLTGSGANDYYAILRLDQQREIENVWVQWWTDNGATVTQFYVDASNDGSTWSNIGSWTGANPGTRGRTPVDVTDGNWEYVRVRVASGDYTDATFSSYGGPGIYAIEPMGDGSIAALPGQALVNWANQPNFGTVATETFTSTWGGTRFNDGFLYDDEGVRTGQSAPWPAGEYAQLDLGAERAVSQSIIVWDAGWYGTTNNIQYSYDSSTYFNVTGLSAPTQYSGNGATGYTFDEVTARYFRLTGAGAGASLALVNQWMLLGQLQIPEPSVVLLLGLGGFLVWRRVSRRRVGAGLALALLGTVLAARSSHAAVYTGTYDWLSQFHTSLSASSTAYNNGVGGFSWAATFASTDNSVDRWRQVTWDADVLLTRVRTETWNQIGTIGDWKIQTSPDGVGSWTDFSSHSGIANVDSSGSVTARAVRVLFPAGNYILNGNNAYGPGIHMIQTEGTYLAGIPDTDPQFNILATSGGFLGTSFAISMSSSPEEGPASRLIDGYLSGDGGRAGWHPPHDGTESITVDLGTALRIHGVQLWSGTFYEYMPSSADVYTSLDGSTYTLAGALAAGKPMTLDLGSYVLGRYVQLTNIVASSYILPHEVVISASENIPEPSTVLLLGLGGLLLGRARVKR